jgi:hypothetical protein
MNIVVGRANILVFWKKAGGEGKPLRIFGFLPFREGEACIHLISTLVKGTIVLFPSPP